MTRNASKRILVVTCAAFVAAFQAVSTAQQVPDRLYHPPIASPAYPQGTGPVVFVDEAHTNSHTLTNLFWAFGELVSRDGFVVRPNTATFTAESLGGCRILVVANAQPGSANWDSYPYPTPSAFTDQEIAAVRAWVERGGALLLIADHLPLAGAAEKLAAAFGVTFTNGFALDGFETAAERDAAIAKPTLFTIESGTLRPHAILRGRNPEESVTRVRTFTGQAFQAPDAAPLLILPPSFVMLMPEKAWQFTTDTRRIPAGGWLQAAVKSVGAGRAAFFGEAAMFSAQVAGPARFPVGMNAPQAEQNYHLVLNVMHWLSGLLPA